MPKSFRDTGSDDQRDRERRKPVSGWPNEQQCDGCGARVSPGSCGAIRRSERGLAPKIIPSASREVASPKGTNGRIRLEKTLGWPVVLWPPAALLDDNASE